MYTYNLINIKKLQNHITVITRPRLLHRPRFALDVVAVANKWEVVIIIE